MGGKAFTDVVPVPMHEVNEIVEYFIENLGNPNYGLLGSTGKKPLSGDIDLAIDENAYDYDALLLRLTKLVGSGNINCSGRNFNQIYVRHIASERKGPYQVDFMIGKPSLLQFTHFAPYPNASNYTGSHRTELIKAVAKVLSPFQAFDCDRMIARVGYTLYHDRGLVFNARWTPPRKDGRGYTMKMVPVEDEDMGLFMHTFPEIDATPVACNFTHPADICQHLFGAVYHKVNSYEDIADTIVRCEHLTEHRDLIWRLYTERLDEIKLPHPVRLI
jgi:hypothetical protein